MAVFLLDLNEDVLVQILLARALLNDWIFIALTSKALYRAALEAFRIVQIEAIQLGRLPGVHKGVLRIIGGTSQHRLCTQRRSIMASARRFMMMKDETDMKEQTYYPKHPVFFVAQHLSMQTICNLIESAPLSMIRGSYFDVLGAVHGCRLNLQNQTHRALVMFAAYFARIDVLDWLVHVNPKRAKAFDFKNGLLGLLNVEMIGALFGDTSRSWGNQTKISYHHIQVLLVRPAFMSNIPAVLDWIQSTIRSIAERYGIKYNVDSVYIAFHNERKWKKAESCFFLGISIPCFARPSPSNDERWRAARLAFCEAAGVGAVRVLDHIYEEALKKTNLNWSLADVHEHPLAALVIFSLFSCVLIAERVGVSIRWLQKKCQEDGALLTRWAKKVQQNAEYSEPHEFRMDLDESTFDLEDLIFVLENSDTLAILDTEIPGIGLLQDHSLRESIFEPGDVQYNRFLRRQLASTCWFERSMPLLRAPFIIYNQDKFDDWHDKNSHAQSLVRRGLRMRHTMCTRADNYDVLPNGFVFFNRLSEKRAWLPHLGISGPSRLEDGLAYVLGQWMIHVLSNGPKSEADISDGNGVMYRSNLCLNDWKDAICQLPAACYSQVDDACLFLLSLEVKHSLEIRSVLRDVLEHVTMILSTSWNNDLVKYRTCAIAYLNVMFKHDLVTTMFSMSLLKDCKTKKDCEFYDALKAVLL